MKKFSIYPNNYLKHKVEAYYHFDYFSTKGWQFPDDLHKMIYILKNDLCQFKNKDLDWAINNLIKILERDFREIYEIYKKSFRLCIIPRAKPVCCYEPEQLKFSETVKNVVKELENEGFLSDDSFDIIRIKPTKTTHARKFRPIYRSQENCNCDDGEEPYPGITIDTCSIKSEYIKNNDILLVDDIYTPGVNVVEDAIQALYENGARSVIFYCVGKTKERNYEFTIINQDLEI